MRKIESICIIEDDRITLFGIRKMLNLAVTCDDISSYVNGKLALEAIKKRFEEQGKVPDIIFLDINMQIMDGWQFLEEFIALPLEQKVRVNIITSSIDHHDKKIWEDYQKRTHHVITYNNKPIRKNQIAEITIKA